MEGTFSDLGYGTDPFQQVEEEQEHYVIAVFPHPLHGRLIDRLIFWVRPGIEFMGVSYKLTWWGGGVAYYQPASA